MSLREEARQSKTAANKGTISAKSQKHKEKLWSPASFDPRLAEQAKEMAYLYGGLSMTNAMPLPKEIADLEAEVKAGAVPNKAPPIDAAPVEPSLAPAPAPTPTPNSGATGAAASIAGEMGKASEPANSTKFKGALDRVPGYY